MYRMRWILYYGIYLLLRLTVFPTCYLFSRKFMDRGGAMILAVDWRFRCAHVQTLVVEEVA